MSSERHQPDRVVLRLPMVSLLPAEVIQDLESRFCGRLRGLSPLQWQALAIALGEGDVSNSRLQLLSTEHPSALTQAFRGLVSQRFLVKDGHGRGSTYRLSYASPVGDSKGDNSPLSEGNSPPSEGNSPPFDKEALPDRVLEPEEWDELMQTAREARETQRLPEAQKRTLILSLCQGRWLTAALLGRLLGRPADRLREKILSKLLQEGMLRRRYPDEPNYPQQSYTTVVGQEGVSGG